MDKSEFSVREILAGEAPQDAPVTVKGWVRTRRDSKAGISFVHLSDGSSFHPVQVVAPNTLPNYADEVLKLTAGCAVEATGTDRAVAGEGAAVRDAGEADPGDRLGRRPGHLSDPAEAAHAGVPARGRASAAAHQRDRRGDAGAAHAGAGDPPLLRRERLLLGQHADHHRLRRGGGGGTVPGVDPGSRQPAAHAGGQGRFRAGFLRPRGVPDGVGAAQCRGLLPRADQGLHLRADLPRRELEHQPPPRRVLDDRAGDRLRRPLGRCGAGGSAAEIHLRGVAEGKAGGSRLLRRADREGAGGEARGDRRLGIRAHGLRRGDRGARAGEGEIRVPGASGASTCSRSTSAI